MDLDLAQNAYLEEHPGSCGAQQAQEWTAKHRENTTH